MGAAVAMEGFEDLLGTPPATAVLLGVAFALFVVRVGLTVRENVELAARAHRQASHDDLTGLRNRRSLLADLDELLGREQAAPHALTLLDLDGFKAYNDAFGHLAGDELLAQLGPRLDAVVGADGRAYRPGGDEFCVLAPAGTDVQALVAALTVGDATCLVTASHGTALLPAEAATPEDALRLADERMYRMKAGAASLRGVPAPRTDVSAELVAVADAYDALAAREPDTALERLRGRAELDGRAVAAFAALLAADQPSRSSDATSASASSWPIAS
jgi:diguanylate cyclase (GGDEF)-like protein